MGSCCSPVPAGPVAGRGVFSELGRFSFHPSVCVCGLCFHRSDAETQSWSLTQDLGSILPKSSLISIYFTKTIKKYIKNPHDCNVRVKLQTNTWLIKNKCRNTCRSEDHFLGSSGGPRRSPTAGWVPAVGCRAVALQRRGRSQVEVRVRGAGTSPGHCSGAAETTGDLGSGDRRVGAMGATKSPRWVVSPLPSG